MRVVDRAVRLGLRGRLLVGWTLLGARTLRSAGVEGLLSSPAPCGVGWPGSAPPQGLRVASVAAVSVRGLNESLFFPPGPS